MAAPEEIKMQVREHYAWRVRGGGCCGGAESADVCCAGPEVETLVNFEGPNLGCGSPLERASVRPGEVVVDLGSGAGREVLLAAQQAAPGGRAIGIDMTPEMVWKARENARRTGLPNAEFRLGEIEHLPLPDASADVVISNCVINLVPDKAAAFREAYRILRPGGRLAVSDIVSHGPLSNAVKKIAGAWAACIAGAEDAGVYLSVIRAAGFEGVETTASTSVLPGTIYSATITARKPA